MKERPTALVVEDHQDARESLAELLEGEGFTVVVEPTAESALRLLEEGFRPDIILVDHQLRGGMSGMDLLHQCNHKALLAGVRAILMSGFDAEEVGELPSSCSYLAKPFAPALILSLIHGRARVVSAGTERDGSN